MSSWTSARRPAMACIAILLTLAALYPRPVSDAPANPFSPPAFRAVTCPQLALVAKERGRHQTSIGSAAIVAAVAPSSAESLRSRLLRSEEHVPSAVVVVRPHGPRAPPLRVPFILS